MKKKIVMKRINTRIEESQHNYIKRLAKKEKLTEGEVFRNILSDFIKSNKK